MTRDEMMRRLADNEDNFTERKPESVNAAEIRRTVVAFANSVPEGRTAVLFIGVHDDGRVLGCSDPDSKQKAVRRSCDQDCYPPITFTSEVFNTDAGPVVAVIIPESSKRPHFAGPAFIRRGSESVAASDELFNELIYSRNSTAAAILKFKNQVVMVVGLGHRLGSTRRDVMRDYREGGEARILECTALTVRFQMVSSGITITEPLDHVRVTYNEERYKPELVVTGY